MPPSIIACRVASYGDFESIALSHLASLGVRNVEIPVPAPHELESTAARLAEHGLRASTLHGACDLSRTDVAARVEAQMPAFAALGTRIMFTSAKAGDTPLETAWARLREAGDVAGRHGVTIALETHPDLITNADTALATMKAVNHPHVRINFDTANLYFYNHNVNGVDELRRMLPYVAAVHLKDTDGGYRSWCFPALGRGVVRFRETFDLLDRAGFAGPCTMEIEGVQDETATERLVCDRIAESVGYLRGLGRL
ncbi:MAG: L-ribulose-5-phosphate 3-epimerase UlaE [Phycisphaerae bacterium]|nr:L-ribulose-5-phosphate 3-epimerase UlaE [Phycisphaerae bacterium]